jgi:transposase
MATPRPPRGWYWIVDEIEAADCLPRLAHALFAKRMMAHIHTRAGYPFGKTDKLDAKGLATLEHLGSLPTVWIAPGDVRDARELPRTRMAFSKSRASLKNRMHSTLAKYALSLNTDSDIFAPKWRAQFLHLIDSLPDETARGMHQELELLQLVQEQIDQLEVRIRQRINLTPSVQLVQTIPGVGVILAIVITLEIGTIDRFSTPKKLTGYSGLVPRVSASGGHIHYGRMVTPSRRPFGKQANNYLKWAFIEAANVTVAHRHHPNWRDKYVTHLYERTKRRKGHAVAVGATARYLAQSAFWVLKKSERYQEPPHWAPGAMKHPISLSQGKVPA